MFSFASLLFPSNYLLDSIKSSMHRKRFDNYFRHFRTKHVFDIRYSKTAGPDQGVGCRCWNTLMEHNKADVWMDARKNLATIADGGATEMFLMKTWLKFYLIFLTWRSEWSLSGWYLGGQRPLQWEASNSSGWKMKEKPSSFLQPQKG